ncbi:MAG: hypothetical protein IJS60_01485 [Abditibacteriota bacterium]|nr:hypothetical protein [Abditibacteriota bacterium]
MKKIFCLLFLILFAVGVNAQNVSVIYSSFRDGNYSYKDKYKDKFNADGLICNEFENTTLDSFDFNVDCILFSTVANYENTQDLTKYPFKEYVEKGGVLIICDANYHSVLDFLPKSFGLEFKSGDVGSQGKEVNPDGEKVIVYPVHHPILKGVPSPNINWGITTSLSPEFKTLYVDLEMRPQAVYSEIGKGLLILSPINSDQGFPNSTFVKNAINYAKFNKAEITPKSPIELEKNSKTEGEFVPVLGNNTDKTHYFISYDDDFLNIDVDCYDHDLLFRTTNVVKRDGPVNEDDSIEILIENDGDIYSFVLNSNNFVSDSKNSDLRYNAYWKSTVESKNELWRAKVSIPYFAFGMTQDSPREIKINIFRNYHTGKAEDTLYSLADLPFEAVGNSDYWQKINFASGIDLTGYRDDLFLNVSDVYNYGNNKITIKDNLAFDIINLTTGETFKGKDGVSVVNFEEVGENLITGVAYEEGRCIGATPIYKVYVNDIMDLNIIYPKYRDQVMSKDPNKNLRINIRPLEKLTVDFSLKGDKKTLFSKKYTANPNAVTNITYNLEKLKVGDYFYTLKILRNGKLIREIRKDFKVLPPNDVEITFDEKQVCYENGKPIFPIMLYHTAGGGLNHLNNIKKPETPPLDEAKIMEELKDRGFTMGHGQINDFGIVDRYAKGGLNIVSEIGDCRDRERLQEFIDAYNRNKNGIFYYTIDEPFDEKLEHDIEMYNILKEMDPYRPCGGAVCFAPIFKDAVKCFDIMMPDAYEITRSNPNPSFSGLFRLMKPANEYGKKNGKALWAVPQSFGWKNFGHWIMPTCEQMKCQAFFYIVYGATGLCWYAMDSGEVDKDTPYNAFCIYDYPEQWDYFKELNKEVTDFAPVIFEGDSIGPLGVNDKVHSNVWKIGNKNYALIVNSEPTPQRETYEIKGNIKPYFEKYEYDYSVEGDKVTFNLKPYECVIVEY